MTIRRHGQFIWIEHSCGRIGSIVSTSKYRTTSQCLVLCTFCDGHCIIARSRFDRLHILTMDGCIQRAAPSPGSDPNTIVMRRNGTMLGITSVSIRVCANCIVPEAYDTTRCQCVTFITCGAGYGTFCVFRMSTGYRHTINGAKCLP